MSQGSSQRRVPRQDVELWEMYEEERGSISQKQDKNNRRDRRRVEDAGRDGQGRGSTRSGRRSSRDREAMRSSGRNAQERYGNRDYERVNSANGRNAGRTRTGSVNRTDRRNVRMYEKGQGDSRQRSRTDSAADRQYAGAGGARRSRSGNASQVGYIQPYPDTQKRRRNPEYAYRGNARPEQSIKRRRARRRRELLCKVAILLFVAVCLGMIYYATGQIYRMVHRRTEKKPLPAVAEQVFDNEDNGDSIDGPPDVIRDFLEINEYSRPGDKLDKVNSIFVHYTANPGTTAAQNRSYFANLAETHERSASAHLIIGYDGELIQCIPFDEQAYAVMTRNEDSISIECCYLSEDGSFTQETYDTLIHTLAWLLEKYNLSIEDILRHYDCGGKKCPLYYAENEGEWEKLRQDVAAYMKATK